MCPFERWLGFCPFTVLRSLFRWTTPKDQWTPVRWAPYEGSRHG